MSTRTLLAEAVARLEAAGVASPRFDAESLLAHVLGVPRIQATLASVSSSSRAAFEELLARREKREPLQHLTGEAPFRHLVLKIGPGVFVPRPETEVVAGYAIDALSSMSAPVVVDLCAGSGAIALAVATEVPSAVVYAVELDRMAFEWASRNVAGHAVTLVRGDAAGALPELDGTVDLVVANPPYIPMAAYESVEQEARDHDPALALWSGEDGLDAIRVIERSAARLLRPGGIVVVEHADVQGESAPAVFASTGAWQSVRDRPDLAGRPRFVTAVRS